jgi:light-regulated signal transduction histidine kinase (bacteriophytochrome)
MRKLIDDLLTYSKVGIKSLTFEKTDLNRVVQDVISDLELKIAEMGAEMKRVELPIIDADPSQMRQLFQNLISNALKFVHPNISPQVKIECEIKQNQCTISVVDNGIGFEEKYLDQIFTIFQRLHGKHEYEGTGVGLAICRRIVERHGGSITAKSSPDRGTRFLIHLPLRQG